MRLSFHYPADGYHQYCLSCFRETVQRVYKNGNTYYFCDSCKKTNERSLVLDSVIKWWVDEKKVYWHESAGVFVRNNGKFLFFKRTLYPFSLTVPAGHVDANEEPKVASKRELWEEAGLAIATSAIVAIGTNKIHGDSCRRGSDDHVWHAFLTDVVPDKEIKVREEGKDPIWLTPEEALKQDVTVPVRFYLERYAHELAR